jgi:mycothiol synthase
VRDAFRLVHTPAVTDNGDLTWRSIEPADAHAWADLLAAIRDVDRTWEYFSVEDLLEDFGDPYRDFPFGSIGAFDGDAMLGYCVLIAQSSADPVHTMDCQGGVHPAYRRRGLGGRLIRWAEATAVPLHEARHPGVPLSLSASAATTNDGAAALFTGCGYAPARWFHSMAADLTRELPAAPVPDDMRIVGYTPQRIHDARLVRNEAFRDHWGGGDLTLGQWHDFLDFGVFRPHFSFLADEADTGEPVGVLIGHEYEEYAAATGVRDLYVAVVATRGRARKRGIASALLVHALTEAKRAGYTAASLIVDADSLTGAVGLYERVGFTIDHTEVTYTLARAHRIST